MKSDADGYVTAVRKMPYLDREQEADLLRRYRLDGDRRAADTIARAYQHTVVGIALGFKRYDVSVDDLIAEGNLGLLRALSKFDLERGVRFGTYAAYWIRAQMLAHVIKSRSAVSGSAGAWRTQMFFKIRRERARVASMLGTGEEADRALAERLGVSLERLHEMLQRLDSRDLPLEGNGSEKSWLERLEADANPEREFFERHFERSLEHTLRQALSCLDARELFIIEERLIKPDSEARSLADVARHFGISRERVRQLEVRALLKLRREIRSAKSPVLNEWLREVVGRGASMAAA